MQFGYDSKGIGRIAHLATLLGGSLHRLQSIPADHIDAVVGWGLKPTAKRARNWAYRYDKPYISLEDGFVRSLGLGVEGAPLHSLIVDPVGIYYDATRPSLLEQLIEKSNTLSEQSLERAEAGLSLLRSRRLAKYNQAPDFPLNLEALGLEPTRPRVLVVDQTVGDASIHYGLARADSFEQMLQAAITENPGADIIVRTHPDVLSGHKSGYLTALARQYGCFLHAESISPWALLDEVSRVYVVTSQLGFEALMAGLPVRCFGMPFYAGWGLTEDELSCPRRGKSRRLAEVFHAAYLQYCRYVNPYTGERCEFEATVDLLAEQVRQRERFRGAWCGLDFSRWKQRFVPAYLGAEAHIRWQSSPLVEHQDSSDAESHEQVLVWSSALSQDTLDACQRQRKHLVRMEDGFIRSVGLGIDLVRPLSLVLDREGIYYDATRPSELEHLLNGHDVSSHERARAKALRQRLVEAKISKYNVGQARVSLRGELPPERRIILVPGQVETDASIRYGAPEEKTNLALLTAVRAMQPDAFIIYKPHPDVLSGGRLGSLEAEGLCDLEVSDVLMPVLLDEVDEVHTLCSLTGFEALMREIPVTTYGLPFYAGWGLTEDRQICTRRQRTRTLDELVALTLLVYPTYVDPQSGDHINAETALSLLIQYREKPNREAWYQPLYRWVRNRWYVR